MMLNSSSNADATLFNLAQQDAYWVQISGTEHVNFAGYDWFYLPGDMAAREATRTITAFVLSFLNKHLKGEDDHLLDGKPPLFPRVSTFRKK